MKAVARPNSVKNRMRRYLPIYLLMALPFLYLFVYRFYPIFLQIVLAFKKYKIMDGIWGSKWVGFDNFVKIFTSNSISRILVNTVRISLLRLIVGFFPPILL